MLWFRYLLIHDACKNIIYIRSNLANENLLWMTMLISARKALITCPKRVVTDGVICRCAPEQFFFYDN